MKTARVTIKLLREFSADSPELGVSELSRRLDLDKATIHRLLRALCDEGIIEQDLATKKYRLGLAILDLAAARLKTLGFVEQALEEMRNLRDTLGETVAILVRDGLEMVCVQQHEASHPLTVRFTLGERAPIHVTAGGTLILAEMSDEDWPIVARDAAIANPGFAEAKVDQLVARVNRARVDGYAIADQTYQQGVRAIAAPIRDRVGKMVGVLSMVVPVTRMTLSTLRGHASELKGATKRIGDRIPGGVDLLSSDRADLFKV